RAPATCRSRPWSRSPARRGSRAGRWRGCGRSSPRPSRRAGRICWPGRSGGCRGRRRGGRSPAGSPAAGRRRSSATARGRWPAAAARCAPPAGTAWCRSGLRPGGSSSAHCRTLERHPPVCLCIVVEVENVRSSVRRLLPILCLAVLVAAGCSDLGVRNQDAATVNGVGIPTDRLSEMTKAQLGQQQQAQQQGQKASQDIEGATRQALEGLIQFQLVLDGAKKAGVTIEEADVDARMEQLKQQVAAQGQNYEELLRTRQISEE